MGLCHQHNCMSNAYLLVSFILEISMSMFKCRIHLYTVWFFIFLHPIYIETNALLHAASKEDMNLSLEDAGTSAYWCIIWIEVLHTHAIVTECFDKFGAQNGLAHKNQPVLMPHRCYTFKILDT